jgi:hypothetical protein
MDLYSRHNIGWALRETLDSSLVTEALVRVFGCRAANIQARSFKAPRRNENHVQHVSQGQLLG